MMMQHKIVASLLAIFGFGYMIVAVFKFLVPEKYVSYPLNDPSQILLVSDTSSELLDIDLQKSSEGWFFDNTHFRLFDTEFIGAAHMKSIIHYSLSYQGEHFEDSIYLPPADVSDCKGARIKVGEVINNNVTSLQISIAESSIEEGNISREESQICAGIILHSVMSEIKDIMADRKVLEIEQQKKQQNIDSFK